MGNNNLKTNNDILVKVDQNNLIYIDPNSVLSDGKAVERGIEPENLVMYVNLEADLVPRSVLVANNEKSTLTSIAGGTVSFFRNKDGGDYDTKWTDVYVGSESTTTSYENGTPIPIVKNFYKNDTTAQSFGIESISIQVTGANFIPRVVIKFIDVRGKTLFESPENSPYAAFFHLPWPIFYLTVKGYYGKAIKYRLHLIKFNSRFNSNTGNFEIETNFVGSTYAYLADISLASALNAPYFYLSETVTSDQYNEDTGYYDVTVTKSTKGYRILKSVYQEYKNKGLLPPDFPVRTLREMIIIAGRLNKILENQIFKGIIDHNLLSGVKDFEEQMLRFEEQLNAWKLKHLSGEIFTDGSKQINPDGTTSEIQWYKQNNKDATTKTYIDGKDTSSLKSIIDMNIRILEENQTFGTTTNKKAILDPQLKIDSISFNELKDIEKFIRQKDGTFGVDFNGILDRFYTCFKNFTEQRVKLESDIEKMMNNIIKDPDTNIGLGFEPTVRNIIGVLLANAETYIRLMRDVHYRAFEKGKERSQILTGVITDSPKSSDAIFPWPEVKVPTADNKELVLKYPGGRELGEKLRTYDTALWPEIDFVENFYEISTKKADNLSTKEGNPDKINYIFKTSTSLTKKDVGVLTNISNYIPYADKSMSSILYEIYERAKYTTFLNPYDDATITELANLEFNNLKEQIAEDIDIVELLKENVSNINNFYTLLAALSPYERYPYLQDQLPTIPYLKNDLNTDFSIQKYIKVNEVNKGYSGEYINLSNFLTKYKAEAYRTEIYPFNSTTYLSYLNQTEFKIDNLNLYKFLSVNPPQDFISSPINPIMWVKPGYQTNMFKNPIKIGTDYKHILNTPYFHNQLYNDFIKAQSQEKYVGSAYLLLNSLPFVDLDDQILSEDPIKKGSGEVGVLVSTLFRELGATHYIPYHLMLKWGSVYHRYKKYITDSIDIISGVTTPIDGNLFFDDNNNRTYTGTTTSPIKTINRSTASDVGLHPFYDAVFHQIVNGYSFYNPSVGPTDYLSRISDNTLILRYGIPNEVNSWTSFVDNSKFYSTSTGYTLLPSNGYNEINVDPNGFLLSEQDNFRILWNVSTTGKTAPNYSGYTFPSTYEYFKATGLTDNYSLESNYRKAIDLIATFKPDILDVFESAFLDFASEKLNEEIAYSPYDVRYNKFQDLLNRLVYIPKNSNDPTKIEDLIKKLKDKQVNQLSELTQEMLSFDNLIRFSMANPRELDTYILGGFTGTDVKNFDVGSFDTSQIASNLDNIKLYLGEDVDGYYIDFFVANDIELNEDNIKQFRPLIYMYAGLRAKGINKTKSEFIQYLTTNIITSSRSINGVSGSYGRQIRFLTQIIANIQDPSIFKLDYESRTLNIRRGYGDDILKLEFYNYFKSFNDKWTSGNSIGQRTLMEEFLFLDKANRDIGDKVFLDMEKLMRLTEKGNENINLFSAIGLLVQDTGFDIRALPSYINFYGTNYSNTAKITPSKNVAKNIFGTFLDVDTEDSSPRIILQYIGPTSKHPEISDVDPQNKTYRYKNDTFNVGDVNNNPVIVTPSVFARTDFSKSNKVVAFEVSFGDQNQSIFKGVELDQSTIKNTTESMIVTERLGRSESGSSTAQVDIGLFDIYRQASYSCAVTCMGNTMIQPTMYFYLKNIPMFRGSYWITEVVHNIKTSGIETIFKGTRIPAQSLPDPEDSFLASYRPLFDKLVQKARIKVKESMMTDTSSSTKQTIIQNGLTYTMDPGQKVIKNENLLKRPDITSYGIPHDGFDDEQFVNLVSYDNAEWLRSIVCTMGGKYNELNDDTDMNIISRNQTFGYGEKTKIKWSDIKGNPLTTDFYSAKFNLTKVNSNEILEYSQTEFLNPVLKNPQIVTVITSADYTNKIFTGPVNVGPSENIDAIGSLGGIPGISLSTSLMNKLKLKDGDILYFRMIK